MRNDSGLACFLEIKNIEKIDATNTKIEFFFLDWDCLAKTLATFD